MARLARWPSWPRCRKIEMSLLSYGEWHEGAIKKTKRLETFKIYVTFYGESDFSDDSLYK